MRLCRGLPGHVSNASASVPPLPGARSRRSSSSRRQPRPPSPWPSRPPTVPPKGMSMWVWASMKPGITSLPEASTVSAPSASRSMGATAMIFSSSTSTSAPGAAFRGYDRPPLKSNSLKAPTPFRMPARMKSRGPSAFDTTKVHVWYSLSTGSTPPATRDPLLGESHPCVLASLS